MRYLISLSVIALVVQHIVAPPVTHNKKDGSHKENEVDEKDEMADVMEYHRYLKEVVQALESDSEFRAKLEKAGEADIRTGKIAHELEFVNHNIRTKLDELKREELERLRHLAIKENNLNNGLDLEHLKIAEHLDHSNSRTFEINDLKKLIAKTTKDLAEVDRQRREEFKEYEMQKKYDEEQKMKGNTGMSDEDRKKYEAELHAMKVKHKEHEPLHHPGSKQQLEEVWEKLDHMQNQDFDPRTFFYLHDVDGNGMWDQNEVKALFLRELDKLYAAGAPEDDLIERAEEMERMREHVFKEADLNKDGLISYEEFLEQTRKPDFQQDSGWKGLDEEQIYSQQEYDAYQRKMLEEMQRMVANGVVPPNMDHMPTLHEQFPPQYGHVPSDDHGVPQASQQQFHGQPPQQQYHGQQPPQQQYQGHVPQQQYHGQPSQQPGQVPQQHYQGQVPQQVHGQVPMQTEHHVPAPQQPMYQGQVSQQQYQPHLSDPHYQGQPQYQQQQPPYQQQQVPQQAPQQNQQQNQQQPQQHIVQSQVPQQQNPQANAVPQQNVHSQPPQQQQQQQQQTQQNAQTGQAPVQKNIQQNAIPHVAKV